MLSFLLILFGLKSSAQTCSSTNYALNKTLVTSDNPDIAPNLVDGDLLTDWFGGADSKWIYVDLGTSLNLCKVTLKGGIWSIIPQTVIQVSNDVNSWTDMYTIAAGQEGNHFHDPNNSNYDYDYFDVDLSATTTAFRYVRLYFPSGCSWGPHMKELEVYIKPPTVLPNVNITTPDAGSSFIKGSNITIKADASEQGGNISKVEFYQGSTKLGESTVSPYQFIWNNVPAGEYSLTAKAYDIANQFASSSPLEVWVSDPSSQWSLNGNSGVTENSFLGTPSGTTIPLIFKTNGVERLRILSDGRMGIKTSMFPSDDPNVALAVGGDIYARKLRVTQETWADYVFNKNYRLLPLREVETFINKYHHLPNVPTASNVQNKGLDVGDNQALLLQKIEELTLYVLEINKKVEKLSKENETLKRQVKQSK